MIGSWYKGNAMFRSVQRCEPWGRLRIRLSSFWFFLFLSWIKPLKYFDTISAQFVILLQPPPQYWPSSLGRLSERLKVKALVEGGRGGENERRSFFPSLFLPLNPSLPRSFPPKLPPPPNIPQPLSQPLSPPIFWRVPTQKERSCPSKRLKLLLSCVQRTFVSQVTEGLRSRSCKVSLLDDMLSTTNTTLKKYHVTIQYN